MIFLQKTLAILSKLCYYNHGKRESQKLQEVIKNDKNKY